MNALGDPEGDTLGPALPVAREPPWLNERGALQDLERSFILLEDQGHPLCPRRVLGLQQQLSQLSILGLPLRHRVGVVLFLFGSVVLEALCGTPVQDAHMTPRLSYVLH